MYKTHETTLASSAIKGRDKWSLCTADKSRWSVSVCPHGVHHFSFALWTTPLRCAERSRRGNLRGTKKKEKENRKAWKRTYRDVNQTAIKISEGFALNGRLHLSIHGSLMSFPEKASVTSNFCRFFGIRSFEVYAYPLSLLFDVVRHRTLFLLYAIPAFHLSPSVFLRRISSISSVPSSFCRNNFLQFLSYLFVPTKLQSSTVT